MTDYRRYRLSFLEKLLCVGIALAAAGIISWLFYRKNYGMALTPLLLYGAKRQMERNLQRGRRRRMQQQFGEILSMISTSLKSGYSVEHAFSEGWKDFIRLHGDQGEIAAEFGTINRQVQLNIPIEQSLEDLAVRSGLEEIEGFSQVFQFAKRSGGDFLGIFQNTVTKIREKSEVLREVETLMAAKKLEQHIMNLVPVGIIFYVSVTSPQFLNGLYGNGPGVAIMTVCLMIYAGAFWLSQKIMEIEV